MIKHTIMGSKVHAISETRAAIGKNFMVAAKQFTREYEVLTKNTRNSAYVADQ